MCSSKITHVGSVMETVPFEVKLGRKVGFGRSEDFEWL